MKNHPILRRLSTRPAKEQMNDLLAVKDSSVTIQGMDPLALYCLVKEIGVVSALPLVQQASAEQIQAFFDFDCWSGDRIDMKRLQSWFALILTGEDRAFAKRIRQLDPELLGLFLKRYLTVYLWNDRLDAEIIETLDVLLESSPDGIYALVMPDDPDTAALIRLLLLRLFRFDLPMAHQLLNATRTELESVLEETAFGIRNGRLESFGFYPFDESAAIYALVDPVQQRRAAEDSAIDQSRIPPASQLGHHQQVPAPIARELAEIAERGESFWVRALVHATTDAPDRQPDENALRQVVTLVNQSMMADCLDPGEIEVLGILFERVHGFLNIGLEFLAGRQVQTAARLLTHWPLRRIFRTGYSLAASLKAQAEKLLKRGNLSWVEELPASLCSEEESELLGGLLQRHPQPAAEREEGFQTLEQLDAAGAVLARVAYKELWAFEFHRHAVDTLLQILFEPPGSVIPIEYISFDSLLATQAATRLLDNSDSARLLDLSELSELVEQHIQADRLSTPLREHIEALALPPPAHAQPTTVNLARSWFEQLVATLVAEYGQLSQKAFEQPEYLPALLLFRSPPN